MLMSARTINSKASGGAIRFPSITDDDNNILISSPKRVNEPYNSIDPIGKRGTGKPPPLDQMRKTFGATNSTSEKFVYGISMQSVT